MQGNYYNNAFGQYDKALDSYNCSLELDPGYGYAWFSKGMTLRVNLKYVLKKHFILTPHFVL
jgi:lipoprotein NlpI